MNKEQQRIKRGSESVAPYVTIHGQHAALVNCLADLLHWALDAEVNFESALKLARVHYEVEQAELRKAS